MSRKKKKSQLFPKSIILFSIYFIIIIGGFFIYECTIGNPFMDPISPAILWGSMCTIAILLGYKIYQASKFR